MRDVRQWPAPWLFSLLILPLGIVVVGFNFTALPLLLAQSGVPVDRIASISSIINLPGVIGFLFAPVVDIKFRRRTWLAMATFGTALSACLYFPLIGASHLTLMTAIILVGGLVTFLVAAACGGLIVKMLSVSAQSKAAAFIPQLAQQVVDAILWQSLGHIHLSDARHVTNEVSVPVGGGVLRRFRRAHARNFHYLPPSTRLMKLALHGELPPLMA